jgi:hypothetical protein
MSSAHQASLLVKPPATSPFAKTSLLVTSLLVTSLLVTSPLVNYLGPILIPPSNRITSPFSISFSMTC